MTKYKTPAEKAADDCIKNGGLDPAWKEKKRRWMNSRYKWHEHSTINPNGVVTQVIPYEEPLTEMQKEVLALNAREANWKYKRATKTSGKYGEQKHYNPKSTRALTDEEAIICRKEYHTTSMRKLALRFGVSEKCVMRCLKGYTYKHLNSIVKPIF